MPQVVLRQCIEFLAWMLDSLLSLYFWIIIISALLSWVNPDPRNPIVRFLYGVTEPVLYQVRRRLPFVYSSGIDFSPIVVIFAIAFAQRVIVRSLYELAFRIALAGSRGVLVS
jgi:YggT family protein